MIHNLRKLSPFIQLIALIALGFVSYFVLSLLVISLTQALFPALPINDIALLEREHGIVFMLLFYLPIQVGLFLVPGILYSRIVPSKELFKPIMLHHRWGWIIWGTLVFTVLLFLLPFLTEMNIQLVQLTGSYDALIIAQEQSEKRLTTLFGPETPTANYAIALVIIALVTGLCEEFAFRRLLFVHVLQTTGKVWLSIVTSAFFFAILHFNYLQLIPLLLYGVALALIFYTTKTIWVGVLLHALNNGISITWMHTNNFPQFMETHNWKITIPSLFIATGLILWKRKKLIFRE